MSSLSWAISESKGKFLASVISWTSSPFHYNLFSYVNHCMSLSFSGRPSRVSPMVAMSKYHSNISSVISCTFHSNFTSVITSHFFNILSSLLANCLSIIWVYQWETRRLQKLMFWYLWMSWITDPHWPITNRLKRSDAVSYWSWCTSVFYSVICRIKIWQQGLHFMQLFTVNLSW